MAGSSASGAPWSSALSEPFRRVEFRADRGPWSVLVELALSCTVFPEPVAAEFGFCHSDVV